jgi:hypothetical protein
VHPADALGPASREDDHNWPEPDRVGKQELEVKVGDTHIAFTVSGRRRTVRTAWDRHKEGGEGKRLSSVLVSCRDTR